MLAAIQKDRMMAHSLMYEFLQNFIVCLWDHANGMILWDDEPFH